MLLTGLRITERHAIWKLFIVYPSIFDKVSLGFVLNIGSRETMTAANTSRLPKPARMPTSLNCNKTSKEMSVVPDSVRKPCKMPAIKFPRQHEPRTANAKTKNDSINTCKKILAFDFPTLIKIAVSFCRVRIHIQSSKDTIAVPAPFAADRPVRLPSLFCLARVERREGRLHMVWHFNGKGEPVLPHKKEDAGQTNCQ